MNDKKFFQPIQESLQETSFQAQMERIRRILSTERHPEQNLLEIRSTTHLYFIQAYIEHLLKKPLSDEDISFKRRLIEREWENISRTIFPFLGKASDLPEEIKSEHLFMRTAPHFSDSGIEYIFDTYREVCPAYFQWHEQLNLRDLYHKEDLVGNYAIPPSDAQKTFNPNQFSRDSTYSRLSEEYGIIYSPSGSIDSFFKLDPETETLEKEHQKKFGSIREDHLLYFIHLLREALENKDLDTLSRYLQIREILPADFINEWEARYGADYPEELQHTYRTLHQFEQESGFFEKEVSETTLSLVQNGGFATLIDSLEILKNTRQREASARNFGYASERTELLNFFASFVTIPLKKIAGGKHFSILYYLYIREILPSDMTQEFEKTFNITIPEELRSFETYDQFIDIDPQVLAQAFSQTEDVKEAAFWLQEKLLDLSSKIESTKKVPEKISLEEILEEEGLRSNNLGGEKIEELIENYSSLISIRFRKYIEDALHISLEHIDIRTQLQLLNFLSTADPQTVVQVTEFLNTQMGTLEPLQKQQTYDRLVTFLALESQELNFQDIIKMESELGDTVAQEIFHKYSEIHSSAMQVFREMETFTTTPQERDTCLSIRNNLLKKASDLIIHYVQRAQQEREKANQRQIILSGEILERRASLLHEISLVRTDIEFFRSAFQELYGSGGFTNFSEIEGLDFNILFGREISESDRERMREIYAANFPDPKYTQDFRNDRIGGLNQMLEQPDTVFHILKKSGQVIGFLRFDHHDDGRPTHFGSFNIDPGFHQARIGNALFKHAFNQEVTNRPDTIIEADCDPREPVTPFYIRQGFVGVGTREDFGTQLLLIHLNPHLELKTPTLSLNAIKNLPTNEVQVIKTSTQNPDFHLLDEGYLLTRYELIYNSDQAYCIFERVGDYDASTGAIG